MGQGTLDDRDRRRKKGLIRGLCGEGLNCTCSRF